MNLPADFSLAGLYSAIDTQRQARGLAWQQAVLEINTVYGRISKHPIARSSVTGLRTKAVAEGDPDHPPWPAAEFTRASAC